ANRYYAPAVDWLAARGITTGVGGGRYAPDDPVTRAQMATFLWRLAGSPVPA
ncbi:MAG: S-layer homology domain-containing protein, partial [Actinomyces sp.]